jgi:hypothetical protein
MDMVFDAADFDEVPIKIADRSTDVFVESFANAGMNQRMPVFRAEDDVVGQLGERAHACTTLLPPLSRLNSVGRPVRGLTPTATCWRGVRR